MILNITDTRLKELLAEAYELGWYGVLELGESAVEDVYQKFLSEPQVATPGRRSDYEVFTTSEPIGSGSGSAVGFGASEATFDSNDGPVTASERWHVPTSEDSMSLPSVAPSEFRAAIARATDATGGVSAGWRELPSRRSFIQRSSQWDFNFSTRNTAQAEQSISPLDELAALEAQRSLSEQTITQAESAAEETDVLDGSITIDVPIPPNIEIITVETESREEFLNRLRGTFPNIDIQAAEVIEDQGF